MKNLAARILRGLAVPLLGSLRYLATLALVCGLWWYDARLLNSAFDANLAFIKGLGGAVDGSGRVEAAMRAFAAEKMLLFTEASILVWTAGKVVAWPLGLVVRRWRSQPGPADHSGTDTAPAAAGARVHVSAEANVTSPPSAKSRTRPG